MQGAGRFGCRSLLHLYMCVYVTLFLSVYLVYIEEEQGRVLGALVAVLKESARACVHMGVPLQ